MRSASDSGNADPRMTAMRIRNALGIDGARLWAARPHIET